MAQDRLDWILVISGPLVVTSVLFVLGAVIDTRERTTQA
jgi:hypothetical protein